MLDKNEKLEVKQTWMLWEIEDHDRIKAMRHLIRKSKQ